MATNGKQPKFVETVKLCAERFARDGVEPDATTIAGQLSLPRYAVEDAAAWLIAHREWPKPAADPPGGPGPKSPPGRTRPPEPAPPPAPPEPAPSPEPPGLGDCDVAAMQASYARESTAVVACLAELEPLSPAERRRVAAWLADWSRGVLKGGAACGASR